MIELNIQNENEPLLDKVNLCDNDVFQNLSNYNSLLNYHNLFKSLKRNVWKYELRTMLNDFMNNIQKLEQNKKFKLSGKVLNSSAHVLKTKTNTIINSSLETQEDIKDAQQITNNEFSENLDYDDESELFDVFEELEKDNLLNEEEKTLLKQERINRVLNLDPIDLHKMIKDKVNKLNATPKIIYKKIGLNDLAGTLSNVLKQERKPSLSAKPKKKIVDKNQLSFLPEKLISNVKQNKIDFKSEINNFYNKLKEVYKGEPIEFLNLVPNATVEALVNALLCLLQLINQKKIEIWRQFCKEDSTIYEDDGKNLYLSPLF